MSTSERIKTLGSHFHKMEITTSNEGETVIYVILSFPLGWTLADDVEDKFGVQATTQQGLYYFWCSVENGEDKIFDAIEYNIKKNEDAQERYKLYHEKLEELKHIFEDESCTLEELRTLSFKTEKFTPLQELNLKQAPLVTDTMTIDTNKKDKKNKS